DLPALPKTKDEFIKKLKRESMRRTESSRGKGELVRSFSSAALLRPQSTGSSAATKKESKHEIPKFNISHVAADNDKEKDAKSKRKKDESVASPKSVRSPR